MQSLVDCLVQLLVYAQVLQLHYCTHTLFCRNVSPSIVEPDLPCAMRIIPIGALCALAAVDWAEATLKSTAPSNVVVKRDEERL